MTFNKLAIALAVAGFSTGAYATNGMDMEGYGPIATSMGGTSMAYDNGTAAMANNPATLGLMANGSRFDLAIGILGPDVKTSNAMGSQDSSGNSYLMPAIGFVKKNGSLSYGVGVFAQGGMGTEYAHSPLDGQQERSELGVGRLIFPVAFQVNQNLTIGGSVDFVWAQLDLKMAVPSAMLGAPGANSLITGGTGVMGGMATSGAFYSATPTDYMRMNFSDNNDFTGAAKATGYAGKLGFTYKASPTVTVGGVYQSKTSLSDLNTATNGVQLSTSVFGGMSGTGKMTVRDFQWPETYGLGVSVQATPDLMVNADWKHIGWANVMDSFKMTYTAGTGFGGMTGTVDFALPQKWKDQNVLELGGAYKATSSLTLRAGANFADNPIPDATMNYLFPAIIENSYMAGFGYAFNPASEVNFSYVYAPKVTQTNPSPLGAYTTSHSQTNWQLMYSYKF
jgi:long-chain fatty acid transport protein